ncbi:MAG: lamin tail domain-containing protein [Candidatus Zixiibacteriota bacterium]|nr:MAG: lamin tail domain-containing protein [candidate division Zixibacteria bacterium]
MKRIILTIAVMSALAGFTKANPIPAIRIEYVSVFPPQIGVMIYSDSLSMVGDTIFTTSGSAVIGQYEPPEPYEMLILDSTNTTGFVISNESDSIEIRSSYPFSDAVLYGNYWSDMPPIKGHAIILGWCDPSHHGGGWQVWYHEFMHVDYGWTDIVINEINANCDWRTESNFIELYNQCDSAIDIGGWMVICDTIFVIPQNTVINANGFYIIDQCDFPNTFDMDIDSDNIYLVRADSVLVDQVGWSSNHGTNISFMRFPDGDVDYTEFREAFRGYDDPSSYTFENGFPSRCAPNRHSSPGFVVIGTYALGFEGNVEIWWTDPIWEPVFDYSVVVRSFTHFPQDINDGDIIYQGTEQHVTDIGLPGNTVVYYTIFARDTYGNYSIPTGESRVSVILGVVGIDGQPILPELISGLECYPNPFNASVTINFVLSQSGSATLSIYNLRGQRVETMLDGSISAGQHRMTWDGSDLPSGVYFARLDFGVSSKSIKMVLLK